MATKQEIADVFEKHVSRFGYAKTSLDEVARSMHISKKTIYVHFAGKRELYGYIVEQQAALQKACSRSYPRPSGRGVSASKYPVS